MFVDECTVEVVAGRGGNGCVSFRREKFVPRGGPDGGDGGHGGSVFLEVDPHLRTLSHLRHAPCFRAGAGKFGMGKEMTGAGGADVVVPVPPGTVVVDEDSGELLADAVAPESRLVLARGGRGGRGNTHFKGAVRRAPRFAQPGLDGEARRLKLTLKLLADVGLVGLPNAGKSTLLSRLSNARPKIADYPFTTLAPVLGIVPLGENESLVMADLPGLIAGAHEGRGLGQRFLRHIERTRVLLILIESIDLTPQATLATLRRELAQWSAALARRDFLVCYTKADLVAPPARQALPSLAEQVPLLISSQSGEGLDELLRRLRQKVLAGEEALGESAKVLSPDRRSGGALQLPPGAEQSGRPGHAWPTDWVVPQRPGARAPEQIEAEETSGG